MPTRVQAGPQHPPPPASAAPRSVFRELAPAGLGKPRLWSQLCSKARAGCWLSGAGHGDSTGGCAGRGRATARPLLRAPPTARASVTSGPGDRGGCKGLASAHLAPHTWTVVVEGATGGQGGTLAWATGQNTPVQGGSPPSPVPLAPALSPGSPEAARQAWGAAGSPGQVSASSDSHPWAPGASPQPWGSCSRPRFRLITASRRGCWGHPAPRLRKPELPLIPNNTSVVQAQAPQTPGMAGTWGPRAGSSVSL